MTRNPGKAPSAQLPLFDNDRLSGIVNVASVPQRSVFRYPGGKTWLVPHVRTWLKALPEKPAVFIEPFAGGGIVGLTVAFENLAERVILIERDEQVAAVWKTILSDDANWLAERIESFEFTEENVDLELERQSGKIREVAFKTILQNRVNRGGILAPGAGRIKVGEAGRGLASRWYPQTLKRRILDIVELRDVIEFIEGDGLHYLEKHGTLERAAYFIDPPYTASGKSAGSRLYKYSQIDHNVLFDLAEGLVGDFLMTYDNDETVQSLALARRFDSQAVSMKNTHHAKMTELLIGRSLRWLTGRTSG